MKSQCDLCGAVIQNAFLFDSKYYGSTCIKKVLRRAGLKSSKKFGYLYNDLSSIKKMLRAEKAYRSLGFVALSSLKNEAYKEMTLVRSLIGTEARRAVFAAITKKSYRISFSKQEDEMKFFEVYDLANKHKQEFRQYL